jgi:GT2 family glycosyltransferase
MTQKNLFAFVTFGNTDFSREAVKSLRETSENIEYDIFAIIGKPGDVETEMWLEDENIPYISHSTNYGFPYSINDIYDYAWKTNSYDNLILFGNDIVFYPYAAESLVKLAEQSDYEVISALQYDVKDLVSEFADTKKYFTGSNLEFSDFDSKPWNNFTGYSKDNVINDMKLYDIQNLCLYKRSVFDKVGYTDVNFYPAYFVDNDYARRIVLSNIKCCTLTNARFFHFWSRTIHQETGGSTNKNFENNRNYYSYKWGGAFGEETKTPDICINDRSKEIATINLWKNKR